MESFFVIHLSLMSECMRMMLSQTFLTFGSSHRTTAFPSLVANVSATAEYNDQNTKHNAKPISRTTGYFHLLLPAYKVLHYKYRAVIKYIYPVIIRELHFTKFCQE